MRVCVCELLANSYYIILKQVRVRLFAHSTMI